MHALSQDVVAQTKALLRKHGGNVTKAAKEAGVARTTMQDRVRIINRDEGQPVPNANNQSPMAEWTPVPDELGDDFNALCNHAMLRRSKRLAKAKAKDLREVRIKETKPIGLLIFGDPHLDDDYTDLDLVREHLAMTWEDGVAGLCVGDFTNNWVGKLERLYGDQATTRSEAEALIEGFVAEGRWLALGCAGNHDKWQAYDPVKWVAKHHGLIYHDWKLRMRLAFPQGEPITINCSHNFKGSSIYHKTHGGVREAIFGERDDLYVCGHHHDSGYEVLSVAGKIVRVLRVAGYKEFDRHALVNGFHGDRISPSVLVVLCPEREPAGRVSVFEDLGLGLSVLKALRISP